MPDKSRHFRRRTKKSRKPLAMGILAVVAIAVIIISVYYVFFSQPAVLAVQGKVLFEVEWVDATNTIRNGNITIQLRDDKPITSGNFKTLVEQGKYDNTIFHRVIAGFMIQGGNVSESVPQIHDEIGSNNHNIPGTISMAKMSTSSGEVVPNSASSQFFINVGDNNGLDSNFSVFGDVVQGMDVVTAISQVPTVANPSNPSETSVPVNEVTLISATVLP